MIKKSLTIFLLALFAWIGVLYLKPNSSIYHAQFQRNVVVAETYLIEERRVDTVILGSSLAARIDVSKMLSFKNLSLDGLGPFDGMTFVKQKSPMPSLVLIEVNTLYRDENESFRNIVSSTSGMALKKQFSFLKSDKQPLGFLISSAVIPVLSFLQKEKNDKGKPKLSEGVVERSLPRLKNEFSKSISGDELSRILRNLEMFVNEVEAGGGQIVFFEMPVHPDLLYLNRPNQLREAVQNRFKSDQYPYIKIPNDLSNYHTTDGVHLDEASAMRYTIFLKDEIIDSR